MQQKAKEAQEREMNELFKPVIKQVKVPLGTWDSDGWLSNPTSSSLTRVCVPVRRRSFTGADMKSVVCEFYKAGTCTKGSKCKFSHDWDGTHA